MQRPTLRHVAVALFALGLFACGLHAQDTDRAGKRMDKAREKFAAADADHDGLLTRDEAKQMPHIAAHFDEIDADHNGKVSMQEIAQYFAAKRTARKP